MTLIGDLEGFDAIVFAKRTLDDALNQYDALFLALRKAEYGRWRGKRGQYERDQVMMSLGVQFLGIHLRQVTRTMFFFLAIAAFSAMVTKGYAGEKTVSLDGDTIWVISPDEPESLQRALRDVETDWYKVFGRLPTVFRQPPKSWHGVCICFGVEAPWLKDLDKVKYPGPESFLLRVQPDPRGNALILATGADLRGAIYAAYALSEEFLGVDPWYYWVDKEPEYKGQIELPADYNKLWGSPTFKYRGWFINDEDLLSRFAHDPLKENIISLPIMDRIYETLLRLRGNTIILPTFTFPDEGQQVLAAKRGLINSQHHVNVVGLNTFQWPKDIPYSYYSHPEFLEEMWKKSIDAMKDREVIWTVGYRGKDDHPFWEDATAKTVNTRQARGKLISDAIAKQVELVRQVQPDAVCIHNLWDEGVALYKQGHIRLPEGVTLVWPDDGSGIIRDKGEVKAGQGIYYHTAMFSSRNNQLSEMVNPARIHQELGRFVRAGATAYFVVNLSDVRPVPLSTGYAMKMAWDAAAELDKTSPEAMHQCLLDWSRRQFGEEVAHPVASIYQQYFDTPYMQEPRREGDNRLFFDMRALICSAGDEVNRGAAVKKASLELARQYLEKGDQSLRYLAALAEKAETLKPWIPQHRSDFYQAHVLTQIAIHHRGSAVLRLLCEAILALGDGDKSKAIEYLDNALKQYDALFLALRKAEYGRWRGWYAGERFVQVYLTHNGIKRFRACLTGEPQPIARATERYQELYEYQGQPLVPVAPGVASGRRFRELYEYQEKFKENFPLLYPQQ